MELIAEIKIRPPKQYSREQLKQIRESLFLSAEQFAELLGVKVRTIPGWKQIPASICRLLEEIEYDPVAFLERYKDV